jgi:hypothetical protein
MLSLHLAWGSDWTIPDVVHDSGIPPQIRDIIIHQGQWQGRSKHCLVQHASLQELARWTWVEVIIRIKQSLPQLVVLVMYVQERGPNRTIDPSAFPQSDHG